MEDSDREWRLTEAQWKEPSDREAIVSRGGGGSGRAPSHATRVHTRMHTHGSVFPEVRLGLFDSCPLGYIWRGLHLIAKMDRRARSLVDEEKKNDDDEKQTKNWNKVLSAHFYYNLFIIF